MPRLGISVTKPPYPVCLHITHRDQFTLLVFLVSFILNSSSSIGATARCGLWPVEQCPSVLSLSITNFLHLLTPSTWRSLSTSSFHRFLGLPLPFVPSSSWVKIFLGILSSYILSRWPSQLILCPFIHITIFSPLFNSSSSRFVLLFPFPISIFRTNLF